VIEDVEGATSEPTGRLQVVALSALSAAVSLIVLLALVLPPSDMGGPQAASPAASPSASAFTMTFARPDTRVTWAEIFSRDGTVLLQCLASTDASPLVFARPDMWGPFVIVGPQTSTARSVPVPVAAASTGWLSVNCATSEVFTPWEMFAR
jgi:hypothetical protein